MTKTSRVRSLVTAALLVALASPAGAQGLLDKAKDAVKKTSIGQGVTKLGAEAKLLDATTVELDSKNLSSYLRRGDCFD